MRVLIPVVAGVALMSHGARAGEAESPEPGEYDIGQPVTLDVELPSTADVELPATADVEQPASADVELPATADVLSDYDASELDVHADTGTNELSARTADELSGTQIVIEDGQIIGEITEVGHSNQHAESVAIVAVGGFLGVGEKAIAIPLSTLEVLDDSQVRSPMTRSDIENEREFTTEVRGVIGYQTLDDRLAALSAGELDHVKVVSPEGEEIGEINEVGFSEQYGANVATVEVGGFLGVGEKNLSVPVSDLSMMADGRVRSRLTAAELASQQEHHDGALESEDVEAEE